MYKVTVTGRPGFLIEREGLPTWDAVKEWLRGIAKVQAVQPGTVATVQAPEGASVRYSLKGGGAETLILRPLQS